MSIKINPQPCINCGTQYRCSEIINAKCVYMEEDGECGLSSDTNLEDLLIDIYGKLCLINETANGYISLDRECSEDSGGITITHNLNLTDPKAIIIQVIENNTNYEIFPQFLNFTANSVDIENIDCIGTYDIKIIKINV
jgi:hypothetical protein